MSTPRALLREDRLRNAYRHARRGRWSRTCVGSYSADVASANGLSSIATSLVFLESYFRGMYQYGIPDLGTLSETNLKVTKYIQANSFNRRPEKRGTRPRRARWHSFRQSCAVMRRHGISFQYRSEQ